MDSTTSLPACSPSSHVFSVRFHGARGDGMSLDTAAINAAILAAEAAGGGVVTFPPGDYLSHSVRLRSRVTLRLEAGATLIAADPPPVGENGGYDAPEPGEPNVYQDFGHSRFRNSLVWGEGLEDVIIEGPGRIFGRGLSRGNGRIASAVGQLAPQPPGRLPDVLEADGPTEPDASLDLAPAGSFGYPHARDTLPAGVGNKAIALKGCRQVILRDLVILHGGHFAVLAAGCDNLTIEGLLIDTNRDGIDIDGCCNVRITRCSVNSPWDDGICLKSSCGHGRLRPVENVTISDCFVSGYVEGTLFDGTRVKEIQHRGGPIGRIKLGTESSAGYRNIVITNCVFEFCRGLALEQVDGGVMEDIVVSNIVMREVMNAPVFIRLGARLRTPGASSPGSARRISITNVVAHDVAPDHGVFIAGTEGHRVSDVGLSGIQLHFRGGGTEADAARQVPEMERGYPEPYLFGTLPAWGLFVRHAAGLRLRDVLVTARAPDARPPVWLEDVALSYFSDVHVQSPVKPPAWVLRGCQDVRVKPE